MSFYSFVIENLQRFIYFWCFLTFFWKQQKEDEEEELLIFFI